MREIAETRTHARSQTRRGECPDAFVLPRRINFALNFEQFASFFWHGAALLIARGNVPRDASHINNSRVEEQMNNKMKDGERERERLDGVK